MNGGRDVPRPPGRGCARERRTVYLRGGGGCGRLTSAFACSSAQEVSNLKFETSNLRFEVSNFKLQT